MNWFSKLFKGKYLQANEIFPIDDKSKPFIDNLNYYSYDTSDDEECVALTTLHNFKCNLEEHNLESQWLITTKEEILSPRFQEKLKRDKLTAICKELARRNPIRRCTLFAPSPFCHCDELSWSDRFSDPVTSPICKFLQLIKLFICRMCENLKTCKLQQNKFEETSSTSYNGNFVIFSLTSLKFKNIR